MGEAKYTGPVIEKILVSFEELREAYESCPDVVPIFAVVGWQQWSELLKIPEFASLDFVGPDELPYKGMQAKKWLGTTWILQSCYYSSREE